MPMDDFDPGDCHFTDLSNIHAYEGVLLGYVLPRSIFRVLTVLDFSTKSKAISVAVVWVISFILFWQVGRQSSVSDASLGLGKHSWRTPLNMLSGLAVHPIPEQDRHPWRGADFRPLWIRRSLQRVRLSPPEPVRISSKHCSPPGGSVPPIFRRAKRS